MSDLPGTVGRLQRRLGGGELGVEAVRFGEPAAGAAVIRSAASANASSPEASRAPQYRLPGEYRQSYLVAEFAAIADRKRARDSAERKKPAEIIAAQLRWIAGECQRDAEL
jgi:hypothetical protein